MAEAPVMLGMQMPDIGRWSERVTVALGKNPGPFTGPGTNTYIVGTGPRRILLDTGDGRAAYLPVLDRAMGEAGCEGFEAIVLTHAHPDHIGGVRDILEHYGPMPVHKFPWPEVDETVDADYRYLEDGDKLECEGATLRALHTPGHSRDHICFILEEEQAAFSGDNVLGVGTTVIPARGGSLLQYMESLERLLAERLTRIYPAHGPCIEDGPAKLREYIDHRRDREGQILATMDQGASQVRAIVKVVYAAYPEALHAAAGQSVTSHLIKLHEEGRVIRDGDDPLTASWQRA